MSQRVLVQFVATPEMRSWFRDAAHAERKTLSDWLRGLAENRASEFLPRPETTVRGK